MMKMGANNNYGKQKNKISIGKILTKQDFMNTFFPDEVKMEINDSPFYLLIFISREDSTNLIRIFFILLVLAGKQLIFIESSREMKISK